MNIVTPNFREVVIRCLLILQVEESPDITGQDSLRK